MYAPSPCVPCTSTFEVFAVHAIPFLHGSRIRFHGRSGSFVTYSRATDDGGRPTHDLGATCDILHGTASTHGSTNTVSRGLFTSLTHLLINIYRGPLASYVEYVDTNALLLQYTNAYTNASVYTDEPSIVYLPCPDNIFAPPEAYVANQVSTTPRDSIAYQHLSSTSSLA